MRKYLLFIAISLVVVLGYSGYLTFKLWPLIGPMWRVSTVIQEYVDSSVFGDNVDLGWLFAEIDDDLAVIEANKNLLSEVYILDVSTLTSQGWMQTRVKTLEVTMLSEYVSLAENREQHLLPRYSGPLLAAIPRWLVIRMLQHGAFYLLLVVLIASGMRTISRMKAGSRKRKMA